MSRKAYSLRQAAAMLGVHHGTLSRWIQDGEGPRTLRKPGHKRDTVRILADDLDRFIREIASGGVRTK